MLNIGLPLLSHSRISLQRFRHRLHFSPYTLQRGSERTGFSFFVQNIKNKLPLEKGKNKITEVIDPCAESFFLADSASVERIRSAAPYFQ